MQELVEDVGGGKKRDVPRQVVGEPISWRGQIEVWGQDSLLRVDPYPLPYNPKHLFLGGRDPPVGLIWLYLGYWAYIFLPLGQGTRSPNPTLETEQPRCLPIAAWVWIDLLFI